MTTRFNRRDALKLLAGTSAGAALPWLATREASGQDSAPPERILFIEVGAGCRRTTFEPNVGGGRYVDSTTVTTDWTFRPVMSALEPYRARATMFDHLDMVSAKLDPSSPANAHLDGASHMLTATNRQSGSGELAGGPSIDQFIAQRLNANGPLTRLPSLEVVADEHGEQYKRTFNQHAFSAPGQRVPSLAYIPDIWERIFPEPIEPSGGGANETAIARKTSIYNFVRGDYQRLVDRLGGEDRTKVQQMLDYRAQLQSRLAITSDRQLNRPDRATILDPWSALQEGYQRGNTGNRLWKVHYELIGQMVAAALHTDTTRVVNYSINQPPGYEFGYVSGNFGSSDAHDLTHKVSGDNPTLSDSAAAAVIDEEHRLTYIAVRHVLDQLASLQETDGQSLLDHTLVLLYSHIAEGSHDITRLPWVVFGSAGGRLKMGQYIRFPVTLNTDGRVTTSPNPSERVYTTRGRPHNDLFTSLARAMDIDIDSFGNPSVTNTGGYISEMFV